MRSILNILSISALSCLVPLVCRLFAATVSPELVFASGFEPDTQTDLDDEGQRAKSIHGRDRSTGFDWQAALTAEGREFFMNYVDHSGGSDPFMLGADLAADPEHQGNTVFATWQNEAEYQDGGFWSRVQAELRHCAWPEVFYRVRFRLDEAIAFGNQTSSEDLSLSIFELGGTPGFHLTRILLHKWGSDQGWSDGSAPLRWRAEVRTPELDHAFFEGSDVVPRYGQWQTLAFFARAGDETSGRYRVAIDGETLFDVAVQTKDAGVWETLGFLKSYGGPLVRHLAAQDAALVVHFDDVEIWTAQPPGAFSPERERRVSVACTSAAGDPLVIPMRYTVRGRATLISNARDRHKTVGFDADRDLALLLREDPGHGDG